MESVQEQLEDVKDFYKLLLIKKGSLLMLDGQGELACHQSAF